MQRHGAGGNHVDPALVQFVAVAIGAVKDRLAPALDEAQDLGQVVVQAKRLEQAARIEGLTLGHDAEGVALACDGQGRTIHSGQCRIG
jgi:hypothetical protein